MGMVLLGSPATPARAERSQLDTRVPGPHVMMAPAGLLVPANVLDASEQLAGHFDIRPAGRWGMSPFGGRASDPLWETVKPRQFLSPHQRCSLRQAVVRVAFLLPAVDPLAVGIDQPAHLDELIAARDLTLDQATVARYRELIRTRAATPTP